METIEFEWSTDAEGTVTGTSEVTDLKDEKYGIGVKISRYDPGSDGRISSIKVIRQRDRCWTYAEVKKNVSLEDAKEWARAAVLGAITLPDTGWNCA
jgi:C1A family cysteine protease